MRHEVQFANEIKKIFFFNFKELGAKSINQTEM